MENLRKGQMKEDGLERLVYFTWRNGLDCGPRTFLQRRWFILKMKIALLDLRFRIWFAK